MDSTRKNDESIALRPRGAGMLLNMSERTLWQITHDGQMPCAKAGKTRLNRREALQRWLAERLEGGGIADKGTGRAPGKQATGGQSSNSPLPARNSARMRATTARSGGTQ